MMRQPLTRLARSYRTYISIGKLRVCITVDRETHLEKRVKV